jgi:phosphoribosylaminoimidazole-succinocarboxamide synthase
MDKSPNKINIKLDEPCYVGSVQNIYAVPEHPDLLISETTAGGSVFDVGTIFNIEGSDIGRAGFRHLVFQELQNPEAWSTLSKRISEDSCIVQEDGSGLVETLLDEFCKKGAPTHHVGMLDRESGEVYSKGFPSKLSNLTLIRKYEVTKPELKKVLGWHFYDYKKYHSKDKNVIPLEYIVRLGVTSGSSILRKYSRLSNSDKKSYLNELGVDSLNPWTRFDPPVVDLTTKYEPEDRNISRQEAALISSVDGETFARSLVMAALGAYLLQEIFSKMGLSLWDLKWEIARDGSDLLFVDTIDTDSVRVTYNIARDNMFYFVHFNKQAMRDYYKIMHPEWLTAVNEAKKLAAQSGRPFTEILTQGQQKKEYPANPVVEEKFLDIQTSKFNMIQSFIQNPGKKSEINREAERIACKELDYYLASNKKAEYEELNSI